MTSPGGYEPRQQPLGPPAAAIPGQPPVPQMPFAPPGQPYYGPPMGYPAPPVKAKKGLSGWAIALIVVGAVVVLVCVGGFVVGLAKVANTPKPTYSVTSCTTDSVGFTHLHYIVANHDKVPHDYTVQGAAGNSPLIPDVLVNVAPGDTASGEMIGSGGSGGDTCEITKVSQR